MKATLKNGQIVMIDTQTLFNNQYNTVDGKRIFDRDIERIENDARVNMGRCRYCGAMVKKGEEEKHFTERESKGCAGCFWYRDRVTDRQTKTKTKTTGDKKTTIKTTVETFKKVCTYSESCSCKTDCTLKECRAYGIEWFTPENTFFLKYPNGFSSIPEIDLLPARGFIVHENRLNADYYKKLGSYTLTANLSYENGKATGIKSYRLYNCCRDFTFRYENGELFTDKYSFGWYKVKTLENVPESVMTAIKVICNH